MISISLPPESESRLAEKAKSAGIDTLTYATRVLHAEAIRPPLEQTLQAIRRQFADSGMTEAEAVERYEAEKHAARAAKRGRPFDE